MGYQNVPLGKAQLFDPSRVAGQLRVARKTPKNMQFLAFFGQNWPFLVSMPMWLKIQRHMGYQNVRLDEPQLLNLFRVAG